MQISGRELEKTLHKLLGNVIKEARNRVSERTKQIIDNDPRQAYRAIKHMVYRRVLGGNISILQKRRGSSVKMMQVPEPKKRVGRGGNRIPRSQRTTDLMSYYGDSRGFVLRFLNSGTTERQSRFGNRGHIAARNWFPNAGQAEMKIASEKLALLIEQEIAKLNNK